MMETSGNLYIYQKKKWVQVYFMMDIRSKTIYYGQKEFNQDQMLKKKNICRDNSKVVN